MGGCLSSGRDEHEENDFREMRVRNRRCTDVFCLGIFISFLFALLAIGVYAYTHGDLYKIIYETDLWIDVVHGGVLEVEFFAMVFRDFELLWREILFFCCCALAISLLTVFLIRYFAPIIVYMIYALVVVSTIGISALLWYLWYDTSTKVIEPTAGTLESSKSSRSFSFENFDARTLLSLAVVSSIISIFLTLIVWCLWPRGALVINLFKQAGKAVQKMPTLLFQPVITSFVLLLFLCYWGIVFAFLYTSANPYSDSSNINNSSKTTPPQSGDKHQIVKYDIYPMLRYMIWVHIFGLIWISEFIFASQRMVIAGAIACWYFAKDRNAIGSPCIQAIRTLFRYHLGSVAFGSLIITAVKFPRYVFMYLYAKLSASNNKIVKCLLGCVICLLKAIEQCLRYLHHNAYTVIAISGQSFCPASKTAANILLDNAVNVATINSVGDFVLFLAKSMVAVAVGCAAGYTFYLNPKVNYWYIAAAFCAALAYFIANCFVATYEMILDTLFLCYAEESGMVTRSGGSHRYADADFHDFMNSTLQRERNYRRVPPSADTNDDIEMQVRRPLNT